MRNRRNAFFLLYSFWSCQKKYFRNKHAENLAQRTICFHTRCIFQRAFWRFVYIESRSYTHSLPQETRNSCDTWIQTSRFFLSSVLSNNNNCGFIAISRKNFKSSKILNYWRVYLAVILYIVAISLMHSISEFLLDIILWINDTAHLPLNFIIPGTLQKPHDIKYSTY